MCDLLLTQFEEAVFLGHLLGDGHIQKRGQSFRSKISHSIKQKEYVEWKYEKLKRLCDQNHPPKLVINKKANEQNYFFYLQSGKYLKKYHDLFYQPYLWTSSVEDKTANVVQKIKYRKTITPALIEALPSDPLLLAVWFLDDGSSRKDVFSGKLATQGFSKEEQFLLQMYLLKNFGIKTQLVLNSRQKKQYYLSIPSKGSHFSNFVKLISPFVNQIESMKYKISNPRND
uniref:Putative LAGLIDADG homing endonuclease n=1 Tax=Sykidion marinum TaxID=44573 RepID=A0A1W6EGL5_SYKMA|nr:putative LAGLIDADG homing endonuclease [Pseudoneochloris marina]ARK14538.1 putative LAGLIDADG homing endonuclease [Pseudoneochloris marina]